MLLSPPAALLAALFAALPACSPAPAPITAPHSHSWNEEGELVVQGLREAQKLWEQRQPEAARLMAERTYTERWEPELERACEEMHGSERTMSIEYSFGRLLQDLKGNPSREKLSQRIRNIEEDVRKVAADAHFRYPPIGETPQSVPEEGTLSHPLTPEARPNWERDASPDLPEP